MGKGKVCKTLLLKSSAFLKKRKKKAYLKLSVIVIEFVGSQIGVMAILGQDQVPVNGARPAGQVEGEGSGSFPALSCLPYSFHCTPAASRGCVWELSQFYSMGSIGMV